MGQIRSTILPRPMYDELPYLLKETCEAGSTVNEKELLLLSSLGVLSGIIDCWGIYDGRKFRPNLFILVIAPPASGKGIMEYVRKAVRLYTDEYQLRLNLDKKLGTLFIPANASASSLYEVLIANNGSGIIFETEIDTLTTALKQDWGNFSHIMRMAFQQESISQVRKSEPRLIQIEVPKFSVILSGTPGQLSPLIDSSENGLFSRFLFYSFTQPAKWRDVSPKGSRNLDEEFERLAPLYLEAIKHNLDNPFELMLHEEQWAWINENFASWTESAVANNPGLQGSINRLGLSVFKICMTLTMLRRAQNLKCDGVEYCDNIDFKIATYLINAFKANAESVVKQFHNHQTIAPPHIQFLKRLPKEFKREEIIENYKNDFSTKTIDNYLLKLLEGHLTRPKGGHYKKVE